MPYESKKATCKKLFFRGRKRKQHKGGLNTSEMEGCSDFAKSNSSIDTLLFASCSFLFFSLYIGHTGILKQDETLSFLHINAGIFLIGSNEVVSLQMQDEKPPPPVLSRNSFLRSRSDAWLNIPGSVLE